MEGFPTSKPAKANLEKEKVPSCPIIAYGVNLEYSLRCIILTIFAKHFHSEEIKKTACRFWAKVS